MAVAPRSRRFFLQLLVAGGGSALFLAACSTSGVNTVQGPTGFPQGVYSGDPTATSLVVVTRYLPPNGPDTATVDLEVATDVGFASIVQTLTVTVRRSPGSNYRTEPGDYIARQVVSGLNPGTTYYFRFVGANRSLISPVGQTRTLPAADGSSFKMAMISCANEPPYPIGDALLNESDLSFISFNGDTVYADAFWLSGQPESNLEYYRNLYRSSHDSAYSGSGFAQVWGKVPFVCNWDDHEVIDNYNGQGATSGAAVQVNGTTGAVTDVTNLQVLGYQAFFEYSPISPSIEDGVTGVNPQTRVFRRFPVGANAEFFVLDLRQYRDPQGFGPLIPILPPGLTADAIVAQFGIPPEVAVPVFGPPGYTSDLRQQDKVLLGQAQKDWLKQSLLSSTATFKFIISEFTFTEFYAVEPFDRWEGYWKERQELLEFIEGNNIQNVVILTGDLHAGMIARVNPGRSPAIWEAVIGPTGKNTIAESLRDSGIAGAVDTYYGIVNAFLADPAFGGIAGITTGGLKFFEIDTPNYLTVQVNGGSCTLQVKNGSGSVVTDSLGRLGEITLPQG